MKQTIKCYTIIVEKVNGEVNRWLKFDIIIKTSDKGQHMDRDEFNSLLKKAGLTKKKFATIVGLKYGAVANWGYREKKIPAWVKPFLENYIKAKTLDSVKDVICDESSSPIGDKSDG